MNKVLEGEISHPPEDERTGSDEARVRRGFWSTVRKAAGRIPFMEDVVAAYFCALDPSTPTRVRATLITALAYFVVPVDLLPDFIVGIGFTDDMAVLMTAISAIRSNLRPAHYEAAREALEDRGEQT